MDNEVRVEDGIHLHGHVRRDEDDGGQIEYPAKEVEGTGEKAEDATIAGARRHRSPVVDAAGGGDGGGEL